MSRLDRSFDVNSIIGMMFDPACDILNDRGYHVRLSVVDGMPHVGTRDYRLDRVNLTIKCGVVIAVSVG